MDNDAQVLEIDNFVSEDTVAILGFVEATTLGLLTSSFLIEQEKLHQVAQLKSMHIPPVTVFIGGKLRSPFRIYTRKDGKLMVITCEVPIDDTGLYEISSALLDWLQKKKVREIVVIDGIPVKGIPTERPVYVAAEANNIKKFSDIGVSNAESAIIAGMGGAIINESLGKKMTALSLMTLSSVDIPDPGAVLSIVDVLNKVYGFKVDTKILEESVKKLHEEMNKVIDQYNKIQETKSGKVPEPSIYG